MEKSNNGYCNVVVIGKAGAGKTAVINEFLRFSQFIFDSKEKETDLHLSRGNYNVKVHVKELRHLKDLSSGDIGYIHSSFVFILVVHLSSREISYEADLFRRIETRFPGSLIYILYHGHLTAKSIPFISNSIRGIFEITNINSAEFNFFREILEDSIINLSTNRLESVRNKITECIKKGEKSLDIGKSNLTNLYEVPELFECVQLESLTVSNEWAEFKNGKWKREESKNSGGNNHLSTLPSEIKLLRNLKSLIIGGDWNLNKAKWKRWRIDNITPLAQLVNLTHLNVSNNMVVAVPNFCRVPSIETLHLNNNVINKVYFKGEFKNLKELYLSNNSFNSIHFFNRIKFPKISTIDIHGNNIKDLEPLKSLIQKVSIKNSKWEQKTINVAKNPLQKPPAEIINIGVDAVLNYFEELSIGKNYINKDVKLILVGNSEAGKTTLAKYLDNEKDIDVEHFSTHWLEERQISSKHILDKIKQRCTINLFDFGGHDYFHDTHHLFYSSNTIYLLLWDKETNKLNLRKTIQKNSNGEANEVEFQDYPLHYWLDSIKHFIKDNEADVFDFETDKTQEYNSDVLIIQNKVENVKGIYSLDNRKLKDQYPFIYDFINISVKGNRRNLQYFDTILIEILNHTSILGAKLPGYYGNVKNEISRYNGKPILTTTEFLKFCNTIPGVDITLIQSVYLANYLKQVGLIMYYPSSGNKDLIYIDKKWVVDKIYKILQGLNAKKGEFDMVFLDELFGSLLTSVEKENIIKLMIDFKIIFIHPLSNLYIAPLYLPRNPLKVVSLFIDENIIPYRRFRYLGFIHKNVILNLFQEYGKFVIKDNSANKDFYYYWRDGLIIKDPASAEVVKIQFYLGDDEGNAHIDIFKLTTYKKTKFVSDIIQFINDINKDYDLEETVTIDGIDYLSVALLNDNAKNGKLVFTEKSLFSKNKIPFKEKKIFELKNYAMFLEDGIKRKKAVISYSKKDLERVDTFIRYLQPLVDIELIEVPWYCTLMNPADEWDEKIQSHFNEADIIFFMVSEYFYSTSYIVEKEIKTAIDRYDNDKSVKIVPIILEHYQWARKSPYNLQRFSALPYQAKPISDFNNEKLAWNTITASVKHMLEKDLDPGKIDIISRDLQEIYERQVKGYLDKNSL